MGKRRFEQVPQLGPPSQEQLLNEQIGHVTEIISPAGVKKTKELVQQDLFNGATSFNAQIAAVEQKGYSGDALIEQGRQAFNESTEHMRRLRPGQSEIDITRPGSSDAAFAFLDLAYKQEMEEADHPQDLDALYLKFGITAEVRRQLSKLTFVSTLTPKAALRRERIDG